MRVWIFLLLTVSATTTPAATPATPSSLAALRASAPKSRALRRAAFVAFARADRAALADRLAALDEAIALYDAPQDRAARASLRVLRASLHDVACTSSGVCDGDRRISDGLRAAARDLRTARQPRRAAAIDALRELDAAARSFVDAPELRRAIDDALAGVPFVLPAVWTAREASLRATRARQRSGRGAAPKGSSFAVRLALLDVLFDLDDAVSAPEVRRRVVGWLAALGAQGSRDTVSLRAGALELRAALLLADGDHEGAMFDLLRADRLRALDPVVAQDALPPPLYAKSPRTRALCQRLERTVPPVRCEQIEEQRLFGLMFVDASRAPPHAFSPEEANAVLADYDVLLQRCVQQGARERLTTQTVIELEWAIGNDGRVKSHDLRPMRLRGTSFDACLQHAFATMRFARYPGEMQHMRLRFEVGGEP